MKIGQQILETIACPVVPIGMDPAQMRAEQDKKPAERKPTPETPPADDEAVEISQSVLRAFQVFYIEKKYEEAAKLIQDATGSSTEAKPVLEALKAEWSKALLEQATKLNFLRSAMPKFSGFITTATEKWTALDDKEKESAAEYLKKIGKKMITDMKGRIDALTKDTASEEVMMLAMMVYMFGVGISGEGHVAQAMKGKGEGEGATAEA